MPVWVPPTGDEAGFARFSSARAVARGLTFRPIADTSTATLEWFRTEPAERQAKLKAGLTAEREAEVLAAWHARPPARG
jgi:2'-hydroxyisoflavone reductase